MEIFQHCSTEIKTHSQYCIFREQEIKYKEMKKEELMRLEQLRRKVINDYFYQNSRINVEINSLWWLYNHPIKIEDSLSMALNIIFRKYLPQIKLSDTENIYFSIGEIHEITEYHIEDLWDFFGDDKNPEGEALYAYKNLEQEEIIYINKEEQEEFEKKHDLVYPIDIEELMCVPYMLETEFPRIRTDFLTKAFETNQEEAKKYVLKKYSHDIQSNKLLEDEG